MCGPPPSRLGGPGVVTPPVHAPEPQVPMTVRELARAAAALVAVTGLLAQAATAAGPQVAR